MEAWQREHITKNLQELVSNTIFNGDIQAELRAKNIFSKADLEKLNAEINQHGNSLASYHCYEWLMGRLTAYKVLTKALLQSSQTGAARILIAGVPKNVSDKPLTYLGISVNWEGFKDMEIEVYGNKLKLHEFLPTKNYEKIQQIFHEAVSELEIFDTFVTKQKTFVLANNTVPSKPPYYVPRFLSNRIKIKESIFKLDCSDVFVFRKTLARHKLFQIAKPHFTDTSTSQLNNITCRFISLEEDQDWFGLKMLAEEPIHLINYEANQDNYLLEDSSAPSDILKKIGSREKRVYMPEEEFVQQQLSGECTSSSVCICDNPGMGKTYLLANIARVMAVKCTGRIVVFIQLTSFAQDFFPGSSATTSEHEITLIHVFSYICPHGENLKLLLKLVKSELLQLQIFFDGFDEIPIEKVKWMKKVFQSITTNFPKVKIYITSRPHMRLELEQSLGLVAYDILPFNQQNQVGFLVQFWQNLKPHLDKLLLQSYATNCLKGVNDSFTKDEKEIAGIPLLCQLIAEVYKDKVATHLFKRKLHDVPLKISEMYKQFIEKKINIVAKDKKEFESTKNAHIWHALKLLFPTNGFHKDNQFKNVDDLLTSPEMLRVGILQKHSSGVLEFIHRTFAEFLVAEYFFAKVTVMEKTEQMNCDSISILKLLLNCQKTEAQYGKNYHSYNFLHPVIVSFFNSVLVKNAISEELKMQAAAFVSPIPHEEFNCILCASCQHNLFNVFCLLTQSFAKWDKSRILECFTEDNSYALLRVCIKDSSSQLFQMCTQLFAEVLKLDLEQINTVYMEDTLLRWAVQCVNYEAVEYFIDRVSLKNQSILEVCVEQSYKEDDIKTRENILHLLHNKDSSLINENPNILLMYRIDVGLFKMLVEFGANLTAAEEDGENCAMNAANYMLSTDYHELVQFLLTNCKAEYLFLDNEKWEDSLPFILEIVPLLPETLELLLKIPGLDINMKDMYGQNLLFSAAGANTLNNLQQLLDHGLDYNARGRENRSLLHVAAESGADEIVRHLLSLKLDTNSRDQNKWTPLHFAAISLPRLSVVKLLVENGANVQAKTILGQTALHHSAKTRSSVKEAIKYLIGEGANVNERDKKRNTPLHLCILKENRDCLIEMGADIHAKNKKGQTALHTFVQLRSPDKEVIKYFIEKGVGLNDRDNDGNTPLHLCKTNEAKDWLIEMGADIHAKNKKGQTPAQTNPELNLIPFPDRQPSQKKCRIQ